jgi:hypothetical protein
MAASQELISFNHSNVYGLTIILGGYNFVGETLILCGDTHGTYVLSTMGGIKMRSGRYCA